MSSSALANDARARLGVLTHRRSLDRRAVLEARPQVLEIASRLEDGAPTDPRGVAMVHELLTDGSSPLYASSLTRSDSSTEQLHNRLDQTTSALGAHA